MSRGRWMVIVMPNDVVGLAYEIRDVGQPGTPRVLGPMTARVLVDLAAELNFAIDHLPSLQVAAREKRRPAEQPASRPPSDPPRGPSDVE